MSKQVHVLCFFFMGALFYPAYTTASEKTRTDYRKQLVVQTTIFEKTKDGKIPLKTFKIVLDKTGPEKFHMHMNDNLVIFDEYTDMNLGIRIQYVWTKTTTIDYYAEEKIEKEVDALVINVFTKELVYFADKNILTPKQYVMQKMGAFYFRSLAYRGNNLKVSKTMILNPVGYQHAVLDNVRVFDLHEGMYGVFEIHVKIKQK